MLKMFKVKFKYADSMSNFEWRNQECTVSARDGAEARKKCIALYGLGIDCDYQILSIEEV